MTSVSGVVINISGGESEIFFLSDCDVSPCLTWIVRSSYSAYLIILRKTSLLSALNGVT